MTRRRTVILLAACVPPAVYLFYIAHYAVPAPISDDWSRVQLVSHALHGRLTFTDVWGQYSATRLVVPNLFFVAFGFINHLDLRVVVMFSAVIFVGSYVLLLATMRAYVTKPVTVLSVLSVGLVWFSPLDVQNALWAFQIAWYLTLFFFVVMIFLFFVWPHNRPLVLALTILVAIAGSLSIVQGFVLWPVGLVCILWTWSGDDKRYGEAAVWLAAGLLTTLVYLRGYEFGVGCFPVGTNCGIGAHTTDVVLLAKFVLTLVGRVVPVWARGHLGYTQSLGAVVLAAAVFVVVRSLQTRKHDQRIPLPLLLIAFALLFDVTIAFGRVGEGVAGALGNRYSMPNIVLLVGIVIYALAHPPSWPRASAPGFGGYLAVAGAVLVGILVLGQTFYGTRNGVREARAFRTRHERDARTVVNLDRIPALQRTCAAQGDVWNYAYPPAEALRHVVALAAVARRDRLMIFKTATFRKYRAMGPPATRPPCRFAVRSTGRIGS